MDIQTQPIEAAVDQTGTLLSKIGDLLFKGLENLLNSAARYQEENGVVKQVNDINVTGKDGEDYVFTVKLSPVKNKQDIFYVEIDTNAPNVDTSSINGKTVKLNKDTRSKFNDMILNFMKDNGMTVKEGDADTEDNESEDDESEEQDFSERLAELVDIVNEELESTRLYGKRESEADDANAEKIEIVTELSLSDDAKYIQISIVPYIDNIEAEPDLEETVNSFDPRGNLIKLNDLKEAVKITLSDYLKENNIKTNISLGSILSSTSIKATFIKSPETNQVELRAINTSTDLSRALDVICDVTEDEDFTDMLTAEPQSFEIVDMGYGYDVNPVDGFDTCCVVKRLM